MTADLQELYQEVILDHNKRPRNFRALEDGRSRRLEGTNGLAAEGLEGGLGFGLANEGPAQAQSHLAVSLPAFRPLCRIPRDGEERTADDGHGEKHEKSEYVPWVLDGQPMHWLHEEEVQRDVRYDRREQADVSSPCGRDDEREQQEEKSLVEEAGIGLKRRERGSEDRRARQGRNHTAARAGDPAWDSHVSILRPGTPTRLWSARAASSC